MEKTGSTSIQGRLVDNARSLAKHGIHYPFFRGLARNHNFLASFYVPIDSSRLSRGVRKFGAEEHQIRKLASYHQEFFNLIKTHENVIISSEHLFRLNREEIWRFSRDLQDIGVDDVRVFGYLRSPDSFYLSFAQQEIKGSCLLPSCHEVLPYASNVSSWREFFDCRFESFHSAQGSDAVVGTVLDEVSQFFNLDRSCLVNFGQARNESLSPEEMQIIQDYRRFNFPDRNGHLNSLTGRLIDILINMRDSRWRKPRLRPEIAAYIIRNHDRELSALHSISGVDLTAGRRAHSSIHDEGQGGLPLTASSDFTEAREIVSNFDDHLYRELLAKLAFRLANEPSLRRRMKLRKTGARLVRFWDSFRKLA